MTGVASVAAGVMALHLVNSDNFQCYGGGAAAR